MGIGIFFLPLMFIIYPLKFALTGFIFSWIVKFIKKYQNDIILPENFERLALKKGAISGLIFALSHLLAFFMGYVLPNWQINNFVTDFLGLIGEIAYLLFFVPMAYRLLLPVKPNSKLAKGLLAVVLAYSPFLILFLLSMALNFAKSA